MSAADVDVYASRNRYWLFPGLDTPGERFPVADMRSASEAPSVPENANDRAGVASAAVSVVSRTWVSDGLTGGAVMADPPASRILMLRRTNNCAPVGL